MNDEVSRTLGKLRRSAASREALVCLLVPVLLQACTDSLYVRSTRAAFLQLLPDDIMLPADSSLDLVAVARNEEGRQIPDAVVGFTSRDTTIVVATAAGRVTARRPGSSFIVAQSGDALDSTRVTVPAPPGQADSVAMALDSLRVPPGVSIQLRATVFDSMGRPRPDTSLRFRSRNPSVAMTNALGLVTGVAMGATWIIAESGRGRDSTLASVPLSRFRLELAPSRVVVRPGESQSYTATVYDYDDTPVPGARPEYTIEDRSATFAFSPEGVIIGTMGGTGLVIGTYAGATDTMQVVGDAPFHGSEKRYLGGRLLGVAAQERHSVVILADSQRVQRFEVNSLLPNASAPGRPAPLDIALAADGFTAYALNEDSTISVLSFYSGTQLTTWAAGPRPRRMLLSGTGRLYVSNERGEVRVLSQSGGALLGVVPATSGAAGPMALTTDGQRLYVAGTDSGEIVAIDTEALRVIGRWRVGGRPQDLTVTSHGRVFVADTAGMLKVINPLSPAADSLPVWHVVAVRAVNGGGEIAAAQTNGGIMVLDAATGEVVRYLALAGRLRRAAYEPALQFLYITDEDGFLHSIHTGFW